jgi:hypothetical protein
MNQKANADTPLHHYLCAVEVTFQVAEGVTSTTLSAVMANDQPFLPAYKMAQAQQLIAAQMTQRMGKNEFQILDATMLTASYIGLMTPNEFSAPPKHVEIPVLDHDDRDPLQMAMDIGKSGKH